MRSLAVIAGGWSVSCYNLRELNDRVPLIAVNDAALYTRCHYALTMDRLWIESRYRMLNVLGVPNIWVRKGVCKHIMPDPSWVQFVHDGEQQLTMTTALQHLNGSNSGTCALNLAFQLRPERVFLLGFDMQRGPDGDAHWYPPYPWAPAGATKRGTYETWAAEFDAIAKQFVNAGIEVLNVTHRSLITSFPKISFLDFLGMSK